MYPAVLLLCATVGVTGRPGRRRIGIALVAAAIAVAFGVLEVPLQIRALEQVEASFGSAL